MKTEIVLRGIRPFLLPAFLAALGAGCSGGGGGGGYFAYNYPVASDTCPKGSLMKLPASCCDANLALLSPLQPGCSDASTVNTQMVTNSVTHGAQTLNTGNTNLVAAKHNEGGQSAFGTGGAPNQSAATASNSIPQINKLNPSAGVGNQSAGNAPASTSGKGGGGAGSGGSGRSGAGSGAGGGGGGDSGFGSVRTSASGPLDEFGNPITTADGRGVAGGSGSGNGNGTGGIGDGSDPYGAYGGAAGGGGGGRGGRGGRGGAGSGSGEDGMSAFWGSKNGAGGDGAGGGARLMTFGQGAGGDLGGKGGVMGSSDPDDYFSRIKPGDNIFKIVERRYGVKVKNWALAEAQKTVNTVKQLAK